MRAIMLVMCAFLASGERLMADTFHLKDGKKIEGTILRDTGDSYEVDLAAGGKTTVKKDDLEKISPVTRTPVQPLTGASFSFDKKAKLDVTDLLSGLDPKTAIEGSYRFAGKALSMTSDKVHAKIQAGPSLPDEYDLEFVVSKKDGAGDIWFGLFGGGRQFVLCFDAFGSWSGLSTIDGKPAEKLIGEEGVVGKKVFGDAKPRTVTVMMRREGVVIRLDGKDFYTWRDFTRLGSHPVFSVPDKTKLGMGCYNSTWVVAQAKLSVPAK